MSQRCSKKALTCLLMMYIDLTSNGRGSSLQGKLKVSSSPQFRQSNWSSLCCQSLLAIDQNNVNSLPGLLWCSVVRHRPHQTVPPLPRSRRCSDISLCRARLEPESSVTTKLSLSASRRLRGVMKSSPTSKRKLS